MKLEQLSKLRKDIPIEQLNMLVGASEKEINEYLRIQEHFNTSRWKLLDCNDLTSSLISSLYKLSIHGYGDIVNFMMNNVNAQEIATYRELNQALLRITRDINNGIYYNHKFLKNIIPLIISYGYSYYIDVFDLYTKALKEDELIKPYIIDWLSNNELVIKRFKSLPIFIKYLKHLRQLYEQNQSLTTKIETLNKIVLSDILLNKRTPEEHEYLVKYFVYSVDLLIHTFDVNLCNDVLKISTGNEVVKNRTIDQQLYLLHEYNEILMLDYMPKKSIIRLFTDEKVYTKLSFDFQVYLIKIINNIKENYFFIKFNKLLDQEDINLEVEIRKLLKKYTDYGITVAEIIKTSPNAKEAISMISCAAEYENITTIDENTKLVLVPNCNLKPTVDSIKDSFNR